MSKRTELTLSHRALFDVHITEWKTSINWAISCPGG
jgi:hypothetical protein